MARGTRDVRLLVVLSDTHTGSSIAPFPQQCISDGMLVGHGPIQEWLWSCWTDLTERWLPDITGSEPYNVIHNGDAVEGHHHGTAQVFSPEVSHHANAACEMLRPIFAGAMKRWFIRGTGAHVGNTIESTLGKNLKCEADPSTGMHAAHHWLLKFNGSLCSFRHHMSTTGRVNLEPSGLGIHLGNEQLGCARAGHPVPQVVVRGHRHRYGLYSDGQAMFVACPSMQLLTDYGEKVAPAAIPTIGAWVLDARGKRPGELPDVRVKLFTLKAKEPSPC